MRILLALGLCALSGCATVRPPTTLESVDRWCRTGYMDLVVRDLIDDFVGTGLVHQRCAALRAKGD
jgi:hypothetical protein